MEQLEHLTDDEKKAVAEIKQSIQALVGDRMKSLVLFGSKARGDFDPESDVDLAILVDGLTPELKRKIIDIVADIELKYLVVFSALVLSLEDFRLLRQRERRIALDIENEGVHL